VTGWDAATETLRTVLALPAATAPPKGKVSSVGDGAASRSYGGGREWRQDVE
jgi:hypothetical protein